MGCNNQGSYKDGTYPVNAMPKGKGYTFETRRRERQIIQEKLMQIEDEIRTWAQEGLNVDKLAREAEHLRSYLKDYW